jgi:DNA-binding transcriptional LysR family regulator
MGKRMVPTVAGLRLLDAARQTLPVLSDAEEDLGRLASGRESVLRLSTECYTCYHWLPGVLERFRERFPRVDVRVVAEVTRQPVPALLDGRIDLGIVHTTERDDRLDYLPLFRDEPAWWSVPIIASRASCGRRTSPTSTWSCTPCRNGRARSSRRSWVRPGSGRPE